MGNGVCSRRQRRIFQCLLLVTVVCGMMYGGMVSYEMHKQLKRTEATAIKYQQHQESLSAQLQGKHRGGDVTGRLSTADTSRVSRQTPVNKTAVLLLSCTLASANTL